MFSLLPLFPPPPSTPPLYKLDLPDCPAEDGVRLRIFRMQPKLLKDDQRLIESAGREILEDLSILNIYYDKIMCIISVISFFFFSILIH